MLQTILTTAALFSLNMNTHNTPQINFESVSPRDAINRICAAYNKKLSYREITHLFSPREYFQNDTTAIGFTVMSKKIVSISVSGPELNPGQPILSLAFEDNSYLDVSRLVAILGPYTQTTNYSSGMSTTLTFKKPYQGCHWTVEATIPYVRSKLDPQSRIIDLIFTPPAY